MFTKLRFGSRSKSLGIAVQKEEGGKQKQHMLLDRSKWIPSHGDMGQITSPPSYVTSMGIPFQRTNLAIEIVLFGIVC